MVSNINTMNQNLLIRFEKPINQISKFTISFYNPFQLLSFIPNYLQAEVIQNSNPMQLIFSTFHNMLTNFKIKITNFTTGNIIADAIIIASINDQILDITKINDYNISVPIDLTTMTPISGSLIVFINIETIKNIIPIQIFYKKNILK